MPRTTLPPYGEMAHEYAIRLQWDPMRDWMRGDPLVARRNAFEHWRERLMVKIADAIFPRYKDAAGNVIGWTGNADAFADAMTIAELQFMIDTLQKKPSINCPMIRRDPDSPGMRYSGRRTHLEHFTDEDDLHKEVAVNYIDYDRELSASDNAELMEVADLAYATKIRGLHFLKDRSQRPRPYQAALFFKVPDFYYFRASTSMTPSIHAGHCVEGLLIGCAIYESWIRKWASVDPDRLQNLAQFSVDFGDRRVFAGVHYPTDSIVSWIIVLQLIPRLFLRADQGRIFDFVVDAITKRSRLYAEIAAHPIAANDTGMSRALNLLATAIAAGPANQDAVLN